MSLLNRLKEVDGPKQPGLPCKLGSLLVSNLISEEEKNQLTKILEVPIGHEARVSNAAINEALKAEGFNYGMAAIMRHRRKECRCFGPSPKFLDYTK